MVAAQPIDCRIQIDFLKEKKISETCVLIGVAQLPACWLHRLVAYMDLLFGCYETRSRSFRLYCFGDSLFVAWIDFEL